MSSGESVKLPFALPELSEIAVSPDGRQLAFLSGARGQLSKLWVMEGTQARAVSPKESGNLQPIAGSGRIAIKLDEILGPDNAVFDAKTGLAAKIPSSWKIDTARRPANGISELTITFVLPENTEGRSSLLVWKDPQSIPTAVTWAVPRSDAEVDSWLRKLAETRNEGRRTGERSPNYQATKFASRSVGNKRALSWTGEFDRGDRKIVEQGTLIYSETSPCFLQMSSAAASAAELRVAYEDLLKSIRLP